jgi:hypothetical protein
MFLEIRIEIWSPRFVRLGLPHRSSGRRLKPICACAGEFLPKSWSKKIHQRWPMSDDSKIHLGTTQQDGAFGSETASRGDSLTLHEVLEEEFVALHGELPPDYPTSNDPDVRLKAIWSQIHGLKEGRGALCFSGGGIRSATFGLGVLQGLARCGVLSKFHLLSTVSGGGYIGSWLSAWLHRSGKDLDGVASALAGRVAGRPANSEAPEIQNLRRYSNYLSPRLGILSADTWTLIATYVRNLILTSFVILPLLAAATTIPWIHAAALMMQPPPQTSLLLWAGALLAIVGFVYMQFDLPHGGDTRQNRRSFLLYCLAPLVVSAILLTLHWGWFTCRGDKLPDWSFFGFKSRALPFVYFGIAVHFASWLVSLLRKRRFVISEFVTVLASGAVGGWILWLIPTYIFPNPVGHAELYVPFAVPLILLLHFLSLTVFAGISSRWTHDDDREWWGRASGWLFIAIGCWTAMSGVVIFGPVLLSWSSSRLSNLTLTAGGVAGLLTVAAGLSPKVPADAKQNGKAGPLSRLLSKWTTIAAFLFAIILVILVSQATTSLVRWIGVTAAASSSESGRVVDASLVKLGLSLGQTSGLLDRTIANLNVVLYSPVWLVACVAIGLVILSCVMAALVNSNKFSLHAMYRNRLIRAYLGASNAERSPNPFTGFDKYDNIKMAALWPGGASGRKLMPVINIALNLSEGESLAWQERKAASFTVSPLHCGSSAIGYRKTMDSKGNHYGGPHGISLGTAVTISGAAASPNMGYHSSPLVSFVLTLLNVRLGAWLGNPGPHGDKTYQRATPSFSVGPVIAEALGLTNDTSPYVYLSDGGHFENLGLYEMIIRRCHFVVVSDAGQDPDCSFADLGGAVRKIRIDLGVSIEFDDIFIYPRSDDEKQNQNGRNCAIGRIKYSMVDGKDAPDGVLIYIKPACYGREPRDIFEYFKNHPGFPHESTSNQFFTESQFESYRMLGLHTSEQLCAGLVGDMPDLIRSIYKTHLCANPPDWLETLIIPTTPAQQKLVA